MPRKASVSVSLRSAKSWVSRSGRMNTTATGLFHSHPRQPHEAVMVLKLSDVPAVTSIHSVPMALNTLSVRAFTSIFSIV